MIWLWSKGQYRVAIGAWTRQWLEGSFVDRLIQITPPGLVWFALWAFFAYVGDAPALVWLGFLPWAFLGVDSVFDFLHLNKELAELARRDDVILATRAEYIGGHPQLPHGRFVYLTLGGTQADPVLSIILPNRFGKPEVFTVPILDIDKTDEEHAPGESVAQQVLAQLVEKAPKLFGKEQVTLQVRYSADGGRQYMVELTNFRNGGNEVRNWRNYLVCAQAQADTGIEPHGPWKRLKPGAAAIGANGPSSQAVGNPLEAPRDLAGNGHEDRAPSSAFTRR